MGKVTLSPWENRDVEVLGKMVVSTLNALKLIHKLSVDDEDDALTKVRAVALTTILEVESMIEEIG